MCILECGHMEEGKPSTAWPLKNTPDKHENKRLVLKKSWYFIQQFQIRSWKYVKIS